MCSNLAYYLSIILSTLRYHKLSVMLSWPNQLSWTIQNTTNNLEVCKQLITGFHISNPSLPPDLSISSPTASSGIKALQLQLSTLVTNTIGQNWISISACSYLRGEYRDCSCSFTFRCGDSLVKKGILCSDLGLWNKNQWLVLYHHTPTTAISEHYWIYAMYASKYNIPEAFGFLHPSHELLPLSLE